MGVEPTLPRFIPLEEQKKIYQFTPYPKNADGTPANYPPSLQHVPKDQDISQFHIFSAIGLIETQVILQKITPDEDGFLGRTKQWLLEKGRAAAFGGDPEKGMKIQDVVDYNKYHRKFGSDISEGGNIGLRTYIPSRFYPHAVCLGSSKSSWCSRDSRDNEDRPPKRQLLTHVAE